MKNNNRKIYMILAGFGVVAFLLSVFLISPIFNAIEKNSQELVSAKNNIIALELQTTETDNFKKNYESYKASFEKIDQLFLDPDESVDFIKFLENKAGLLGVSMQISLPPSANIQQSGGEDFIIFQLSSSGNFQNILNFIKEIEMSQYLVEIDNLTIQNSTTTGDKPSPKKSDASFTVKAFTKK